MMRKVLYGVGGAVLLAAIGVVLFAWRVDHAEFSKRGWHATLAPALAAAKASSRPILVKLGAPG